MALVKVKQKYQVVIPEAVRREIPLEVGDLVEIKVKGKDIVLRPKAVVDRDPIRESVEEGLADVRAGRVSPAFESVEQMRAWLDRKR